MSGAELEAWISGHQDDASDDGVPWCGAPAAFGGQQPCPMRDACRGHDCAIADDAEPDE